MTDLIGYQSLTNAAMRGVVREALSQTAAQAVAPGEHHFYVSFRTQDPGVSIADSLVERFPEEMTIVIQNQFWDLEIFDRHFEILLKFGGIPQHLAIPFAAITRFVDPSVNFGINFDDPDDTGQTAIILPAGSADDSTATGSVAMTDENPSESEETAGPSDSDDATVIMLDSFRRK